MDPPRRLFDDEPRSPRHRDATSSSAALPSRFHQRHRRRGHLFEYRFKNLLVATESHELTVSATSRSIRSRRRSSRAPRSGRGATIARGPATNGRRRGSRSARCLTKSAHHHRHLHHGIEHRSGHDRKRIADEEAVEATSRFIRGLNAQRVVLSST